MEHLEQFESKSVHILPSTQKGNCRHKVAQTPLGEELQGKVLKRYFKTLERLVQFEPKSVHILSTTNKVNCKNRVTLPPFGAEL